MSGLESQALADLPFGKQGNLIIWMEKEQHRLIGQKKHEAKRPGKLTRYPGQAIASLIGKHKYILTLHLHA